MPTSRPTHLLLPGFVQVNDVIFGSDQVNARRRLEVGVDQASVSDAEKNGFNVTKFKDDDEARMPVPIVYEKHVLNIHPISTEVDPDSVIIDIEGNPVVSSNRGNTHLGRRRLTASSGQINFELVGIGKIEDNQTALFPIDTCVNACREKFSRITVIVTRRHIVNKISECLCYRQPDGNQALTVYDLTPVSNTGYEASSAFLPAVSSPSNARECVDGFVDVDGSCYKNVGTLGELGSWDACAAECVNEQDSQLIRQITQNLYGSIRNSIITRARFTKNEYMALDFRETAPYSFDFISTTGCASPCANDGFYLGRDSETILVEPSEIAPSAMAYAFGRLPDIGVTGSFTVSSANLPDSTVCICERPGGYKRSELYTTPGEASACPLDRCGCRVDTYTGISVPLDTEFPKQLSCAPTPEPTPALTFFPTAEPTASVEEVSTQPEQRRRRSVLGVSSGGATRSGSSASAFVVFAIIMSVAMIYPM